MAQQNRVTLKSYFETADVPTEAQFIDLIDSSHNPSNDGTVVTLDAAQTLTSKTLTAPVLGGSVTGTYTLAGTPTFPASVATLTGSQTLTNKTLSSPIISAGAILNGTVTGTYTLAGTPTFPASVVLTTGAQVLTGKTLSGADNTVTNMVAANVIVADAGNYFTVDTVEAALASLAVRTGAAEGSIASLQAGKIEISDVLVQPKYRGAGDLNDARTIPGVTLTSTHVVKWLDYPIKPVNMGDYDEWAGPPGAAVKAETGTTYAFVLADGGTVITVANAGAHVLTVPANATIAFPVGTIINVYRRGAGAVTLTGATGVTLNGASAGSVSISAQWQGVAALKVGENEWIISGAIS